MTNGTKVANEAVEMLNAAKAVITRAQRDVRLIDRLAARYPGRVDATLAKDVAQEAVEDVSGWRF